MQKNKNFVSEVFLKKKLLQLKNFLKGNYGLRNNTEEKPINKDALINMSKDEGLSKTVIQDKDIKI